MVRFWCLSFGVLALCVASVSAQETPVSALCQILQKHEPRDDVKYIAGVDVNGNPVVPADLNQPLNNEFDVVEIPIDINLAERFGLVVDGGLRLLPEVTNVSVHQDGKVIFGEEDVTSQAYNSCGISRKVSVEEPKANEATDVPVEIKKEKLDDIIEGQVAE